jgi:hypothetical protein
VGDIFGGTDQFEEGGILAVPASWKLIAADDDDVVIMTMPAVDGSISARRGRSIANVEASLRFVYHGNPPVFATSPGGHTSARNYPWRGIIDSVMHEPSSGLPSK